MGYSLISSFSVLHSSQPTYNVFHSYVYNTIVTLTHTYVCILCTYIQNCYSTNTVYERKLLLQCGRYSTSFTSSIFSFHYLIEIVRMYDDGGKISYVHCNYMNIYILDNRIQSVDSIKYI